MGQGLAAGLLEGVEQAVEAQLAVELATQHQGVDEATDQPFGLDPAAVGHRHADPQVGLPAEAIQQHVERRQQHAEQRCATGLGQLTQGLAQRRLDAQRVAAATPARLAWAWVIGGQLQGRLLGAQLLAPVRQLAGQGTVAEAGLLPGGVVVILDRQGRQVAVAALHGGAVQGGELLDQDAQRPTVGNDVLGAEDQHMLIGSEPRQQAAQGRLAEVEGAVALAVDQLLQARAALFLG